MTQTAVKERGMSFSTDLVPKVLDGTKTMTRRTYGLEEINKNPDDWDLLGETRTKGTWRFEHKKHLEYKLVKCPYGQVGDRLYVKETWALRNDGRQVMYKAAYEDIVKELDLHEFAKQHGLPALNIKWCSPRFMFKKYARTWLEITEVRAERLQDIRQTEIKKEGIEMATMQPNELWTTHIMENQGRFAVLWDSINAKRGYGWETNPWVWPIGFRMV